MKSPREALKNFLVKSRARQKSPKREAGSFLSWQVWTLVDRIEKKRKLFLKKIPTQKLLYRFRFKANEIEF